MSPARKGRVALIILDGVGIGAAPDADRYGDAGSDTLGNLADAVGGDVAFARSFSTFLEGSLGKGDDAMQISRLHGSHPIVTGAVPGGAALGNVRPTRWSREPLAGLPAPPMTIAAPPSRAASSSRSVGGAR